MRLDYIYLYNLKLLHILKLVCILINFTNHLKSNNFLNRLIDVFLFSSFFFFKGDYILLCTQIFLISTMFDFLSKNPDFVFRTWSIHYMLHPFLTLIHISIDNLFYMHLIITLK